MSETLADPLMQSLVNDFGGNYVFALDLLEQYRSDRTAVDDSWREYFDRITGAPARAPEAAPRTQPKSDPAPAAAVKE